MLGHTRGHKPRHARTHRNFRAEYDRLQAECIAAFNEFTTDVASGAYPASNRVVPIDDDQFAAFMQGIA